MRLGRWISYQYGKNESIEESRGDNMVDWAYQRQTSDIPSSDHVLCSQEVVRMLVDVGGLVVSTDAPVRPPAVRLGPAHQCSVCRVCAVSVASACAEECLRPRCLTTSARWCSCCCDTPSWPSQHDIQHTHTCTLPRTYGARHCLEIIKQHIIPMSLRGFRIWFCHETSRMRLHPYIRCDCVLSS